MSDIKQRVEELCNRINEELATVEFADDREKVLDKYKDEINNISEEVMKLPTTTEEEAKFAEEVKKPLIATLYGQELNEAQVKEVELKLEQAIINLIRHKPFFGFVLSKVTRGRTNDIPTMGVAPCSKTAQNSIMLLYNPGFVKGLRNTELTAVLEHEVLHVLNEHFLRLQGREPQRFNIACDMSINQLIDGLPKMALFPPDTLEKKRESEYYYNSEEVKNMAAQQQWQQMKGLVGDHDKWKEIAAGNAAEIESAIKDLVSKAYEEAEAKQRGSTPAWIKEMIDRLINRPVRWNQMIRRYISTELSADKATTYTRPHRRREEDFYPGHKREPHTKVFVGVDTSGSMSAEMLGEVLNELCFLHRQYGDVHLVHFDAEIEKVEKFNGKNKIEFHGRGGTSFTPFLDYMMKQPMYEGTKINCVVFTDGFGDNPEDNGYSKKLNVIWAITEKGSTDHVAKFGRIISMSNHRK
jgi:predicted metal-dependent peptidase